MMVFSLMPNQFNTENKIGLLVRSLRYKFRACRTPQELYALMDEALRRNPDQKTLVFTSEEHAQSAIYFGNHYPGSALALILKNPLQKVAGDLTLCHSVQFYVATQNSEFDPRDVLSLLRKYGSSDIAGLEKYLGQTADYHGFKITNSRDKEAVLQELEFFVTHFAGPQNKNRTREYARRICELADELILNAIFDANPQMANHPRSLPFQLETHEAVQLKWGFDGDQFGISVADPFGLIDKDTILKFIDENNHNPDFFLQKSAGLGLKIVFERLHHFIVNVHPRQKTEVICLLRFDKRIRDFESRIRSFHFFKKEEDQSA